MRVRRLLLPAFIAGAAGALLLALSVDLRWLEELNTYGNFDVENTRGFITRLLPGTPDSAVLREYRFDHGVHATPLIALGVVFVLFLVLRAVGDLDVKLGIRRWLTAWAAFVVARFGLLRVSGIAPVRRCTYGTFPFLNCQACEMASGGCPIGNLQAALMQFRFPLLPLVVLVITGLALGRWICGWLCPFGLVADMFDRISLHRWKPAHAWRAMKFVVLGLVIVVPLGLGAFGGTVWLPFCSTLCASGKIYGLLPFYATTGARDFGAAFAGGHAGELAAILWHSAVFLGFIWLGVMISGRLFCRYLCPLGAFLGLFHRISLVRVEHVSEDCNHCGKCVRHCPMGIDLGEKDFLTQSECVRCGRCVALCPSGGRRWSYGIGVPVPGKETVLVPDPVRLVPPDTPG